MRVFRHVDRRFPFLWETADQPPARWHGEGEGPVHYFANSPAGAWAELLRHEEITEAEDLAGIERALWMVKLEEDVTGRPDLPLEALRGGLESHARCRREATRLRRRGHTALQAPSAALEPGGSRGWRVDGGLVPAAESPAVVFAVFGRRPDLVGWRIVDEGRPPAEVLDHVRHF